MIFFIPSASKCQLRFLVAWLKKRHFCVHSWLIDSCRFRWSSLRSPGCKRHFCVQNPLIGAFELQTINYERWLSLRSPGCKRHSCVQNPPNGAAKLHVLYILLLLRDTKEKFHFCSLSYIALVLCFRHSFCSFQLQHLFI